MTLHKIGVGLAAVLGLFAMVTGATGFWTGMFVGVVMATSGMKLLKAQLEKVRAEEAAKEASQAAKDALAKKRAEELEKQTHTAAKPIAVPPPPPPTTPAAMLVTKVQTVKAAEAVPRPGPQPLPDTAFSYEELAHPGAWPSLANESLFASPP